MTGEFLAGSALEAQELLPAVSQSMHSKVYGAKHEGRIKNKFITMSDIFN